MICLAPSCLFSCHYTKSPKLWQGLGEIVLYSNISLQVEGPFRIETWTLCSITIFFFKSAIKYASGFIWIWLL